MKRLIDWLKARFAKVRIYKVGEHYVIGTGVFKTTYYANNYFDIHSCWEKRIRNAQMYSNKNEAMIGVKYIINKYVEASTKPTLIY